MKIPKESTIDRKIRQLEKTRQKVLFGGDKWICIGSQLNALRWVRGKTCLIDFDRGNRLSKKGGRG